MFELHQHHGLHVHLVTNRFIDVNVARQLAKRAGWGRIHVVRVPVEKGAYLAKYLAKHREPCLKGWRLWAGFGAWDWSRVKNIIFETPHRMIYHACKDWLEWSGNRNYLGRMQTVDILYRRTLECGWTAGRGPNGKLYEESPLGELINGLR